MSRFKPSMYTDNKNRTPTEQEDRIAESLCGKRVGGSGSSFYSKGDVRDVEIGELKFLVECKTTKHASLSIKWNWLKKITEEADAKTCEPMLAFEIRGGDSDMITDRDWVAVPCRVWKKIIE